MDLQQLLAAAQQMQSHLINAQHELAGAEVVGSAGGGLIQAKVNGQNELVALTISPDVIDASDPADTAETLADLVLAAVRDAYGNVTELQQEKMGPLASGLGGGLPDLGGLFGGPAGIGGMATGADEPTEDG
jgi:hypothetical protein